MLEVTAPAVPEAVPEAVAGAEAGAEAGAVANPETPAQATASAAPSKAKPAAAKLRVYNHAWVGKVRSTHKLDLNTLEKILWFCPGMTQHLQISYRVMSKSEKWIFRF